MNVYIVSAFDDSSGGDEPERRFHFAYSDKKIAKETLEKGRKIAWKLYWEMETVLLDQNELADYIIEHFDEDDEEVA